MENNFNKFRRSAFGGFNREDVISYIEKMKNEFFDYKKEVELTVEQLNSKIRELEAAYEAVSVPSVCADEAAEEETHTNPVSDINEATRKLRSVADELCRNLSDFMVKVTENNAVAENTEIIEQDVPVEETAETEAEAETETETEDKVSSILKAVNAFSSTVSVEDEAVTGIIEEKKEKKNILDILGGASFLN